MKNLLEASNRFYASYKDSYGFLLLVYLNQKGLIHSEFNVMAGASNVIETMDLNTLDTFSGEDAQRWREAGYYSESICFQNPDSSIMPVFEILLTDLFESRSHNNVAPNVLFDVQLFLSRVDFSSCDRGELGVFLMDCVRRIQGRSDVKRKRRGPYILPDEMQRVISAVMEYDGGIVYSPTAGVCSLVKNSSIPSDLFYACEGNKKLWAAGMCLHSISDESYGCYENKNFMAQWPVKPSYVVLTPEPNNLVPLTDTSTGEVIEGIHRCLEGELLGRAFREASSDCRIVLTSTSEILEAFKTPIAEDPYMTYGEVSNRWIQEMIWSMPGCRKYLKFLEMVILLPKGLAVNPNTTQVVLVFDLAKDANKHVRMVDGSSFFTETSSLSILKDKDLLAAVENGHPGILCDVPFEKIAENDFDLNPAYYVQESIRLGLPKRSRLLGDIVDRYLGEEATTDDTYVINVAGKTIDGKTFPYELKKGNPSRILRKPCLILNRYGNIRPIFYKPEEGVMAGCGTDALSFTLRENIDIDFLLAELNNPYVTQQVAAKQKASSNLMLQLKDLLSIRVFVPDTIDEQREIVKKSSDSLMREYSERYIKELEAEYQVKLNSFKNEMHVRKHTLSNKLNHLVPGLKGLVSAMREKGTLNSDTLLGRKSGDTVQSRLDKLLSYAVTIEGLVKVLTDESQYDEPEEMSVISFIESYCKNLEYDGYEIILDFPRYDKDIYLPPFADDEVSFDEPVKYASSGEYIDDNTISMSPKCFDDILDNIVLNAVRHGFTDHMRRDYAIRFTSQVVENAGKNYLSIKIANNGNPLPKGMTPEKVLQWGETSGGSGLGGWHIANMVSHYGGYVKVNCYPENRDGFAVEYEIGFPVTNNVEFVL